MSIDPERALAAALFARLRAEPRLSALLGSPARVYDEPPADPVHPFVVFGRAQSTPFGGGSGSGAERESEGVELALTLTCVSRFGGHEEAKAVVALLRLALDDAALSLEGHRLVNLRVTFADVFRAGDYRSIHGLLRLRAVVEPL